MPSRSLVIVESPAKARTIARFLGDGFVVEACLGHVRDLPRGAKEVPEAYRGLPWARIGVDTDNDFKPLYVIVRERRDQLRKLKAALKGADELYLATDEDREGESISWHLVEVLNPRVPVKRMVFHEITAPAIAEAVRNWRDLDLPLVDAQETRRILDRLYGYEVSPVLWKKVMPGLSAGRVQSVATRVVVDRERARMRFVSASWWDIEGLFQRAEGNKTPFAASLVALNGARLATGRDFGEDGRLSAPVVLLGEAEARGLAARLEAALFSVRSVEEKPYTARPHPPFATSTLQQEAGRKLRFDARRTMQVAQRLYENGYITYMRTDSTTLSQTALAAARAQVLRLYGPEYLPERPRIYTTKVKNAQEAHEAIRPASPVGEAFRTPEEVADELSGDEARLYELIWKRTIASQMTDARGQSVQVRMGATAPGPPGDEDAEFAASGRVIAHPGFLRAYVEGADDPEAELEDAERPLPPLAIGDALSVAELTAKGHTTTPPVRYTEASLVRALEEAGVGRPSTYATTISTIQERGYVWKKGAALVPSFVAFAVTNLLERHFPELVDVAFTARMEDDLDEIAARAKERVPWLRDFYFGTRGDGDHGLKALVTDRLGEIDAREVNSIAIDEGIVVRVGRYGPYLERGRERANLPADLAPDELTAARARELLASPSEDRALGVDPATGEAVTARRGRFGVYVQVGEGVKPRRASLFKNMTLETVTLSDALALLSLPRVLGVDPADGVEVTAQNGRYGPYIKKGTESRSLATEEQLLTITLPEALALFAQPKRRRGQRGAAPAASVAPLRELGTDPATLRPVVVRAGRYGPYVTDGETNASLREREGDTVEGLTLERAAELLRVRREAGPAKPRRRATRATGAASTSGAPRRPRR